jgi:hypothetical protein
MQSMLQSKRRMQLLVSFRLRFGLTHEWEQRLPG